MVITRGPLGEVRADRKRRHERSDRHRMGQDDLDVVGMFKVDILGLGMLTALSKAITLLNDSA